MRIKMNGMREPDMIEFVDTNGKERTITVGALIRASNLVPKYRSVQVIRKDGFYKYISLPEDLYELKIPVLPDMVVKFEASWPPDTTLGPQEVLRFHRLNDPTNNTWVFREV